MALFREFFEGGSAWTIGAFLHLFFPKNFSENLPHMRFGKLPTKLNQRGDFVYQPYFSGNIR